jgi:hypothetical protein
MKIELKPCPFCGGEAEQIETVLYFGSGDYANSEEKQLCKCKACGTEGKMFHQKYLSEFTNYSVEDFRNNPLLRAKVEEEYESYVNSIKQQAITFWNKRTDTKESE